MAAGICFLDPILSVLGAQEGSQALDYARRYFRIILYGSVFLQVGFGFSHCTRAQGFPTITMISMLMGAGLNTILDPLFIFVFNWGVEGAAWATIISQAASCIWILSFNLGKKAVIRLRWAAFKPSFRIVCDIAGFGSAQFLLQFIMSAVQLIYNTSVGWYGVGDLGVNDGGDVALSGMNIINSIAMMIFMPVFGINQGAQPILGYNYGAKKYDRVFKAYLRAIASATAICITGFVLAQTMSLTLVRLFAPDGSPALLSFAPYALRVGLLMMPINGFQIVSAYFFVVTGRPRFSILLTTLRQFIALIPCLFIFGKFWGLRGVVAAAPVADTFSFIITSIVIFFELRKLRRQIRETRSPLHL
jgi:Na+-driven multidrug efflux pump